MTDDDARQMIAFRDGDVGAFSALVDRYQKTLVRFFYTQCFDRQLAEDLSQETWRRIYRSREDYVPRARFSTFLFRVARNLWIDQIRQRQKRGPTVSLDQEWTSADDGTGGALVDAMPSEEEDPRERLLREELRRTIEEALDRLGDGQRDVFVLAEFEGLRYHEISEILEIPVGTVKSRMFNAMRRLRELLKKEI